MISADDYEFTYSAAVLRVEDRWYICSEAIYTKIRWTTYQYTAPTLKFIANISINGIKMYSCAGINFEMMGYQSCLKLEYI